MSGAAFLAGRYDFRLVALSILIAICASYTALGLVSRTSAARGAARLAVVSVYLVVQQVEAISRFVLRLAI